MKNWIQVGFFLVGLTCAGSAFADGTMEVSGVLDSKAGAGPGVKANFNAGALSTGVLNANASGGILLRDAETRFVGKGGLGMRLLVAEDLFFSADAGMSRTSLVNHSLEASGGFGYQGANGKRLVLQLDAKEAQFSSFPGTSTQSQYFFVPGASVLAQISISNMVDVEAALGAGYIVPSKNIEVGATVSGSTLNGSAGVRLKLGEKLYLRGSVMAENVRLNKTDVDPIDVHHTVEKLDNTTVISGTLSAGLAF